VVRFHLNGVPREYAGDPSRTLLLFLRDDLGVISAKDGCSQAACGACTVQLDGKAVLACATKMSRLEGHSVTTVEGLAPAVQKTFAEAFAQKAGAQCGFCIPGIVMRSDALLKERPAPSREELAKALAPHLCRCTGYVKIVDAILLAAKSLRENVPLKPREGSGRVGESLPKLGTRDVALGRRPFAHDLALPGMLHCALKLSEKPRARLLRLDLSEALKAEGVERILTAADVPGERRVGQIEQDWPVFVAPGEEIRYCGDVLAAVVAKSRDAARRAAALIRAEFEDLEPVCRPEDSRETLAASRMSKGDAEAAFKDCAFVVEQSYRTQLIEHAFLETEACVAVPEDGGLKVFSQGQGVYEDRRQLARVLKLPEERVRVVLVPTGGAFGGKEDLTVQAQAALAAWLLKKPVKAVLSREESLLLHPKRHPFRMDYKLGCSKEGRLLALRARIVADTGAYASVGGEVLDRACGHATGAYFVSNVDIEGRAMTTNNPPCGAMRGFGVAQVNFAMESAMDELCAAGGFDRWQFRWDNALVEGLSTATGQALEGGVGVRACLEAVRDAYQGARHAGLACGVKNTGIGNGLKDSGTVRILVRGPDAVDLCHGFTEMGQGVDTVAVQFFCEETGLPPGIVRVRVDTADGAPAGMTTASRATSLVGKAMLEACRSFKEDLAALGLAALAGRSYRGEWVCDWTTRHGSEGGGGAPAPVKTHYSYSYAAQVAVLDEKGRVAEVVAAHDAGRIVNRALYEGQVEGSVHMGLGFALTEELELERGVPKSLRLRDLGILRAADMPKVRVLGVEVPDPVGPMGAKGVGEIGLVPTAPAVANALFKFDGVRRRSLPMLRRKKPT